MRTRSTSAALLNLCLVGVLCTGCIKNPVKGLTPNDVEPVAQQTYEQDRQPGLYRGEEALDEQDFYHLVGDTKSEEAVQTRRASGESKQSLGVTLMGIGAGIISFGVLTALLPVGGPLGDKGLFKPIYPVSSPWIPYLIIGGGAVTAGVGGWQRREGREMTSGDKRLFDLKHAHSSVEKGRYGEEGLKPENIASLALTTRSGQASYCGFDGTSLADLIAKDTDGRPVKIAGHEDWLAWESDPDDLLVIRGSGSDTSQPSRGVSSPLNKSLEAAGQSIKITVTVKGTKTQASLLLSQDLSCADQGVSYGGHSGSSGDRGRSGDYGSSKGGFGGPGGNGGNGGDGGNGLDVDVEASWVTDAKGNRYALVVVNHPGGEKNIKTLLAAGTKFSVFSSGGSGGSGGDGGSGGTGGSSDSGKTPQYCAGNGGSGGSGGSGGRGGAGGRVNVRATDQALLDLIAAGAPGGNGGNGGYKGNGGSHGSEYSGCSGAVGGPDGSSGSSGASGPDGSVSKRVVSAGELRLVAKELSGAPNLKLDGSKKPKK